MGALDRTVAAAGEHATAFLLAAEAPERDGFLQTVHPAVKLLGVLVLLVVAVTTDSLRFLGGMGVLVAALAAVSGLSLRRVAGRVALPTTTALVVVAPQTVLLEGPAAASVSFGFAGTLTLTGSGLAYVATFTLRVGVCVAALSVLLLTTRFSVLVGALGRLGAPTVAVTLLSITYRYLLVFFRELTRMARARRSRTIRRGSLRGSWRRSGSFLGTFLLRSFERGERVGRSVRARGGTVRRPPSRAGAFGTADAAFGAVVAAVVVLRVTVA